MPISKLRTFAVAAMALVATARQGQAAQLLSIVNLDLADNEFVASFDIKTWDVEILAVCHLPSGWTISAGSGSDPGGSLSGGGGVGAAFLDRPHLNELNALFLVRVAKPQFEPTKTNEGEIPPSLAGTYNVGRYGDENVNLTARSLKPTQYRLDEASGCPTIE